MIIIPDIHGRDFWKEPVYENLGQEPIIFWGDYLDPYEDEQIAPWEVFPQFEKIVWLKEKHPDQVTLLLGNHDIHYLSPITSLVLIAEGRSDLRKMAKLKKYDETHHEIR